jgi:hypothetical protein
LRGRDTTGRVETPVVPVPYGRWLVAPILLVVALVVATLFLEILGIVLLRHLRILISHVVAPSVIASQVRVADRPATLARVTIE